MGFVGRYGEGEDEVLGIKKEDMKIYYLGLVFGARKSIIGKFLPWHGGIDFFLWWCQEYISRKE